MHERSRIGDGRLVGIAAASLGIAALIFSGSGLPRYYDWRLVIDLAGKAGFITANVQPLWPTDQFLNSAPSGFRHRWIATRPLDKVVRLIVWRLAIPSRATAQHGGGNRQDERAHHGDTVQPERLDCQLQLAGYKSNSIDARIDTTAKKRRISALLAHVDLNLTCRLALN